MFKITPDYDLDIMEKNQSLAKITSKVILGLDDILDQEKPDLILVHGDTTTTMAAGLSAVYHQVPIEHVDAGTLELVGTETAKVKKAMVSLLTDDEKYQKVVNAQNPYGDGHTSDRIINICQEYFDKQ